MITLGIDRTKIIQLVLSFLVWLLIFVLPVMFSELDNQINWEHILKVWSEYLLVFIIFLINRFLLMPYLFFKGQRIVYFSFIMILLLLLVSVVYIGKPASKRAGPPPPRHRPEQNFSDQPPAESLFMPPRPERIPPARRHQAAPQGAMPPFANLLVLAVLILGFDSGLIFFTKWLQSEQKQLKIEKESIENKMAFLKNQISPHFFMNTLNNIHALIDISSNEAKAAVIRLSKLMGFMLYESQAEKIPLQKEVDFINSYVDLMRLRFTDDVDIQVDIPETMPNIALPPLLTISYIENAFKHGISYQALSFVHIQILFNDKHISFQIRNSMHSKGAKDPNSGIGLQNAKNRLDLIYGSKHKLEIDQVPGNIYQVKLSLPL